MVNFEFQCATKMIFGKGTEEKVGEELKAYGATRVLFVYGGSSIKRSGLYDRVVKSLTECGTMVYRASGCRPKPACLARAQGYRDLQERKDRFPAGCRRRECH